MKKARMLFPAAALAAALLLGGAPAYAGCYALVGKLEAIPGTSASSTNPNASVGRIDGFVDPLTGQTQSVTVIFTPSETKP